MKTYYYDKEERVVIAVSDTGAVSILTPINQPISQQVEEPSDQMPARAPKFAKGCPECGSVSRHKKECSKASGSKLPQTGTRRRGEPCEECESISSRHKLGCSLANSSKKTGNKAWAALEREEKKRGGQMTERQYDQVKTAHNHGMDPTSIAHEMNLAVKEVNTAILSKTFDIYSA
jgi:hypothetical protein